MRHVLPCPQLLLPVVLGRWLRRSAAFVRIERHLVSSREQQSIELRPLSSASQFAHDPIVCEAS
jgi:hypothetical protein